MKDEEDVPTFGPIPDGMIALEMTSLEEADAWEALVPHHETIVRGGGPEGITLLAPTWFGTLIGFGRALATRSHMRERWAKEWPPPMIWTRHVEYVADVIARRTEEVLEAAYRIGGADALIPLFKVDGGAETFGGE